MNENATGHEQTSSSASQTYILKKNNWNTGVILIVATGIIILFLALVYFNIIPILSSPNQLTQIITPTPTSLLQVQPTTAVVLESCSVKKEGNPLVQDVQTLKDGTIFGTFRGNIQTYTLHESQTSAMMELISPRGDQIYTFTVKEEDGLVYDAIEQKDLTLADLRRGLSVIVSFNCFPDKGGLFRLTRIAVTGKL